MNMCSFEPFCFTNTLYLPTTCLKQQQSLDKNCEFSRCLPLPLAIKLALIQAAISYVTKLYELNLINQQNISFETRNHNHNHINQDIPHSLLLTVIFAFNRKIRLHIKTVGILINVENAYSNGNDASAKFFPNGQHRMTQKVFHQHVISFTQCNYQRGRLCKFGGIVLTRSRPISITLAIQNLSWIIVVQS